MSEQPPHNKNASQTVLRTQKHLPRTPFSLNSPFMALIPFTSETAKEMQLRSARSRSARVKQAKITLTPTSSYVLRRLARVRKQIESLSDDLDAEDDALKKDRLASAISRLSEIERQLANRPLPGSWRPEKPRQSRRELPEPVIDIQPVVSPPQEPKT